MYDTTSSSQAATDDGISNDTSRVAPSGATNAPPANQTQPDRKPSSATPLAEPGLGQAPKAEMSDRKYFQQLPDPDSLMRKVEQVTAPIESIYKKMASIVQDHLDQNSQIKDLQEIARECDQVLQYGRQVGRMLKLQLELRADRGKFDRFLYQNSPPSSE
jgi:hypothetical protein